MSRVSRSSKALDVLQLSDAHTTRIHSTLRGIIDCLIIEYRYTIVEYRYTIVSLTFST